MSVRWWEIIPCCVVELWEQQMKKEEVEWCILCSLVHTFIALVHVISNAHAYTQS